MLKITVCDDNPVHLKIAETMVKSSLDSAGEAYAVQPFTEPGMLISEIEGNGYAPDIAVLDIEIGEEDGIVLAKRLNSLIPQCRIIFLTSYLNYAQDVYEAEHIWFVVKKDAEKYFDTAMKKALRSLQERESAVPGIIVREKGSSIFVPLDQILYISKVDRKAQVRCLNRDYYDTRRPAVLIPDALMTSFIRCHQGYWVNAAKIEELDHETFILTGGMQVPISRTFREEARRCFFDRYRI